MLPHRSLGPLIAALLVSACGGVEGESPDAAWTTNAVWEASGGLPEDSCAPWLLNSNASPETPALTGGILSLATDVDSEIMYYTHPAAALTIPTGTLVMNVRVRFVSGVDDGLRAATAFGAVVNGFVLHVFIIDGEIYIWSANGVKGASFSVPTSDDLHDYRLELNVATGAATISRDGVPVITSTAYTWAYPDEISFGDTTTFSRSTSEWERVSHNAHVLGPCLE